MKNMACRVAFIGCGSGCTGVFVSLSTSDSELLELSLSLIVFGASVAESVASPAPDSSVASCSSSSLLLSSAD